MNKRETTRKIETKLMDQDIKSTALQVLVFVCLFCMYSAVRVIDWSISEASKFGGRGRDDKVGCYCRALCCRQ